MKKVAKSVYEIGFDMTHNSIYININLNLNAQLFIFFIDRCVVHFYLTYERNSVEICA